MGVVNVTPDSFSDGGMFHTADDAVDQAVALHAAGAQIIDIGGESTRPGSDAVPLEEELDRVMPVVSEVAGMGIAVSVDTSKPEVAAQALAAGAQAVNDVTAGRSPDMAEVVARSGAGVVLMHSVGDPKTMQDDPRYTDVVSEVGEHLMASASRFEDAGVEREAIVVDPGIGFGKTVAHNLALLQRLGELADLGYPVLIGTSRKSFLRAVTGIESPPDRDGVTAVTTALAFERGARIFRVHDVASSRAALAIAGAIVAPQQWEEWLQG